MWVEMKDDKMVSVLDIQWGRLWDVKMDFVSDMLLERV